MRYFSLIMILLSSYGLCADNYEDRTYSKETLQRYADKWSQHFDLDPEVVRGVIHVESGWNHKIVSTKGAIGLMQVMPETAKELKMPRHFSLYNPYTNIYYGCKYLRKALDQLGGDYRLALIAYYSGPQRAEWVRDNKMKEGPFKEEILDYARRVLKKAKASSRTQVKSRESNTNRNSGNQS